MNTYILIYGTFARLLSDDKGFLTIQLKPNELKMIPSTTPYEEVLLLDEEVPQLQMDKKEEEILNV